MSNTLYWENTLVEQMAERINSARELYGPESAYVIGLITAIDWIGEDAEGGSSLRDALYERIDKTLPKSKELSPSVRPDEGIGESPAAETADSLAENTWIKGAVKWFNNDKGYGFISTDSQVDVFVHWRDISSWDRSLVQGDEVEFMVTRTAKGYQAINVMKAGEEPSDDQAQGESTGDDARTEDNESKSTDDVVDEGGELVGTDIRDEDDGVKDDASPAGDGENIY